MSKTDSWWEAAVEHRGLSSVLGDDLEGWGGRGGGMFKREGICICIQPLCCTAETKATWESNYTSI